MQRTFFTVKDIEDVSSCSNIGLVGGSFVNAAIIYPCFVLYTTSNNGFVHGLNSEAIVNAFIAHKGDRQTVKCPSICQLVCTRIQFCNERTLYI